MRWRALSFILPPVRVLGVLLVVAVVGASPASAPAALPGANDASCEGAPVVLVHGTRADGTLNWPHFVRRLLRDGYCPWTLDLPDRGQAPMVQSAEVLAGFVGSVREATGATRVSIVGHSQGGLIGRRFVKFLGGKRAVRDLVSVGTRSSATAPSRPAT